ncbi:tRNA-uridine aminocarboxypropyltransferase [Pseudomonas putida]|uniref:tRNA-uridine aminocarboxypropyltransferase n=1 Tax=Pseudomonas putida TaxID=303 RepID=UPI000819493A|nr:DTW domain-containing protein [Pseudomonas putida]OCT24994.1 DTW domain-containing protein [Pseudomonas putida]OCT28981.1 DTW domain-containing protein [Pseudomonas putida]OCT35984.1 DTW domain-containing protein [Pseudomonas putida]OCT39330.1 DTW domain-containing protein [Pseudomonas putida]
MPRPRCERCQRPLAHCLCPLIPSLDSRTRVVLLQHPSEASHALNTARLAALGLRNVELLIGEVFEDLPALLATPGYRPVLLFPGEQAEVVSAYGEEDDALPLLLIVPDGTWRKARKLLYLNPLLERLPRVTLADVAPSRYRLRKAPEAGAVSTIEAVVQALNVLEQPANFDELLRPFEALIEGQISAMGAETFARNHGQG